MATNEEITRHDDADPDDDPWVGGPPPAAPIAVVEYDAAWPTVFEVLAGRVRDALGDRVLGLEHVGSTSVPGLAAKPVIDIDLTVVDSSDEAAYVPALEAMGFVLRIREPNVARASVSDDGRSAVEPPRLEPGQPRGDPPPHVPGLASNASRRSGPVRRGEAAHRPTSRTPQGRR